MKKQIISTVIGPCTPKVLGALAKVSRESGAEWLSSKLIMLDGHFAAMMRVSIDGDKDKELRAVLASSFPALSFFYAPVMVSEPHAEPQQLTLDAKDRQGLSRDINDVLANLGVAVLSMESHRVQVDSLGDTLFNATLSLGLPPDVDVATLITTLETLVPGSRVHRQAQRV